MHGASIPPPNVHFPSAASRGCPVTSAATESTISFFSASATTLDNPSGICPIALLAYPTILIAVSLYLFVSSSTHFPVHCLFFPNYEIPQRGRFTLLDNDQD